MAQNMVQWRPLVNAVINLFGSIAEKELLD